MTAKDQHHATMGRSFLHGALIGLCLFFSCAARGDILTTKGGESLSGDLSRIAEGILVFRTSLRGQLMMPVEEIERLQTKGRWIVELAGGGVHIGRFANEGIVTDGDGVRVPVVLNQIRSAKKAPPLAPRGADRWDNDLATGVQVRDGNDASLRPFAALFSRGPAGPAELELRLRAELFGSGEIGDRAWGALTVFPEQDSNWGPIAELEIERDTQAALALRTGVNVGLRYEFGQDRPWSLRGTAGLAGIWSRWSGWDRERWWHRRMGPEEDALLGVQVGVQHARPVLGRGVWDSRLVINSGAVAGSDFGARAETALTYPLSARLRLRLDMLLSYEESPIYRGLESLDTTVGASVQVKF